MNKIFMGILRLGRSNPMVLEIFATKKEIFLIISTFPSTTGKTHVKQTSEKNF
jgi:hypothetical protein